MVDGIAALFAVLTPDGAVEDVNDKVLHYFGKTLEELKGWMTSDAVHPDDLPHVTAVARRSFERGEAYDVRLRQRRGGGGSPRGFVAGRPAPGAHRGVRR